VRAFDGGSPSRVSLPVVATLNILRNDFTPQITSQDTYTIREDVGADFSVGTITTSDSDTTVSEFWNILVHFYPNLCVMSDNEYVKKL